MYFNNGSESTISHLPPPPTLKQTKNSYSGGRLPYPRPLPLERIYLASPPLPLHNSNLGHGRQTNKHKWNHIVFVCIFVSLMQLNLSIMRYSKSCIYGNNTWPNLHSFLFAFQTTQ